MTRIESRELLEDDPKRGFRDVGEFLRAVMKESKHSLSNPGDPRLRIGAATPTTYGNELSGTDGGFAVPIEFAQTITDLSQTEDALLPLCDVVPIESNSMVFPADETTPWGSASVRSYWQSEGTAGTQTKPAVRGDLMRLKKLFALCPVTDELSEDSPALGTYLSRQIAKSIRWRTNDALLFGTGAGIPLGAFSSNAVITIAKETGQATQTLQEANITKMVARLPPGSFGRAIWLFNGDSMPAFFAMSALSSVYFPGGQGMLPNNGSVFGLVVGRPALISAHAKSFSSQGDVVLFDPDYIQVIEKAGGVQIATSLHVYFDADVNAFRASFRLDAQPKLTAPIAPANGSTQLSPFVQLGAR